MLIYLLKFFKNLVIVSEPPQRQCKHVMICTFHSHQLNQWQEVQNIMEMMKTPGTR